MDGVVRYDADTGALGKIMRFDGGSGAFIDTFVEGGQLAGPLDLTFGVDGNLCVGSRENRRVLVYDGVTVQRSASLATRREVAVAAPPTSAHHAGAFEEVFLPTGSEGLGRPGNMLFATLPEPTTAILLAAGLASLALASRARRCSPR